MAVVSTAARPWARSGAADLEGGRERVGERGASGEGSPWGRGVGVLILSEACSGAGRRAGPSATAGAVGRTVGGRGEKVTTVGRWQLGHLGRPGAMEWAEAQGGQGVFCSLFVFL